MSKHHQKSKSKRQIKPSYVIKRVRRANSETGSYVSSKLVDQQLIQQVKHLPDNQKRKVLRELLEDAIESELIHTRQVIVYPDEDNYWVAECPSLPPCISQGETKKEAIENIKEAIQLYLEVLRDEGRSIPEDRFETVIVDV
ncbi:type II toxin-antitoxin system HicB family antitoxin [Oscillatoria sp. FACHB-1407]|nr:type II toxin-antitoxin system HicB family antitoxin [Oscillatoria sp. FACHB-1407]